MSRFEVGEFVAFREALLFEVLEQDMLCITQDDLAVKLIGKLPGIREHPHFKRLKLGKIFVLSDLAVGEFRRISPLESLALGVSSEWVQDQ
jgi:hypothetical protein